MAEVSPTQSEPVQAPTLGAGRAEKKQCPKSNPSRGVEEIPKGSKRWFVRCVINGRLRKFRVPTMAEGTHLYWAIKNSERLGLPLPERFREKAITLQEIIEDYVVRCEKRASKSLDDYQRTAQFWVNALGPVVVTGTGGIDTGTLVHRIVNAAHKIVERGRTGSTANRALTFLRACLYYGEKSTGKIKADCNPFRKKIEFYKETGRHVYITPAQFREILSRCTPSIVMPVLFSVCTSRRRDEVLSLAWAEVDLDHDRYHAQAEKGGQQGWFPLSSLAREILIRQYKATGGKTQRVFNLSGSYVSHRFKKAAREAGFPEIRLHDLRHFFASWLASRKYDLGLIQELLAHRNINMTRRYEHFTSEQHLEASEAVAGMLKEAGVALGDCT